MVPPGPSPTADVSVLMPAYNVGTVIADNIARVAKALIDYDHVEIIVCDDGSTDDTGRMADQAAAEIDCAHVVHHASNQGKGAALRTAFAESTGSTVVFLDGDLDLPPEQLPEFLERFRALGVDALVGEKSAAMDDTSYPAVRRILSKFYSTIVAVLFRLPIRETQTGLKVFRRDAIAGILPALTINRFTFDIELLGWMVKRGATVAQSPVRLAPTAATTGLSVGTLLEMGRDTLLAWWRLRRRR
jgi:glycosyltransferase involved in cell wall biosynthesis